MRLGYRSRISIKINNKILRRREIEIKIKIWKLKKKSIRDNLIKQFSFVIKIIVKDIRKRGR